MDALICSCYTLAGVSPTEGGVSSRYFESRMKAAANAGYRGVGIHVRDCPALRASGYDDLRIAAVLNALGLEHIEIEFLLK